MGLEMKLCSHPGISSSLVVDDATVDAIPADAQHDRTMTAGVTVVSGSANRAARRITVTLTAVGAVITGLCLCLIIGVWANDLAIEARTGHATAEVLSVGFARTVVRFTTPDQAVHIPPNGVLYPSGLAVGQLVRVEYDTTNPDLVRVAGRGVRLALLPVGSVVFVVWAVVGSVIWWLRRERPRQYSVRR
jgi:hypothetical protein